MTIKQAILALTLLCVTVMPVVSQAGTVADAQKSINKIAVEWEEGYCPCEDEEDIRTILQEKIDAGLTKDIKAIEQILKETRNNISQEKSLFSQKKLEILANTTYIAAVASSLSYVATAWMTILGVGATAGGVVINKLSQIYPASINYTVDTRRNLKFTGKSMAVAVGSLAAAYALVKASNKLIEMDLKKQSNQRAVETIDNLLKYINDNKEAAHVGQQL